MEKLTETDDVCPVYSACMRQCCLWITKLVNIPLLLSSLLLLITRTSLLSCIKTIFFFIETIFGAASERCTVVWKSMKSDISATPTRKNTSTIVFHRFSAFFHSFVHRLIGHISTSFAGALKTKSTNLQLISWLLLLRIYLTATSFQWNVNNRTRWNWMSEKIGMQTANSCGHHPSIHVQCAVLTFFPLVFPILSFCLSTKSMQSPFIWTVCWHADWLKQLLLLLLRMRFVSSEDKPKRNENWKLNHSKCMSQQDTLFKWFHPT